MNKCLQRFTVFPLVLLVGLSSSLARGIEKYEQASQNVTPKELCCEWSVRPLNVDNPTPRLSWRSEVTRQYAYQIQVASIAASLAAGRPDLWDSGKVNASTSLSILYGGKVLKSRQRCYWRVRIWAAADGATSAWSDVAVWEMGLLKPSDWTAQWIRAAAQQVAQETPAMTHWLMLAGDTVNKNAENTTVGAERLRRVTPATLLRKQFNVARPVAKARLYSTAAGYVEVFIDGKKVNTRVLNPAQTDFETRILYDADAVEEYLEPGTHTLSAHLGEGFYGQTVAFMANFAYGKPSLIMQLEITYKDGETETIPTDRTWMTHPSPVLKNNVYAGEFYDARLETPVHGASREGWTPAAVIKRPTQRLESQILPPVVVTRDVLPKKIFTPKPAVWVFDFEQNFAGFATLHLKGVPAGTPIYLRYSEWADDRGNINPISDGSFATNVHQADCYITKGTAEETWTPSFTWHGFRYIEVTGLAEEPDIDLLTGHLVRSGVRPIGSFESSDPHLNRIHKTALWTYESNLISIPSDCPVRERCGWTGDAHATLTMSNYNYDMAAFWEKYLGDFRTSDHITPSIVPGKRGGGKPDWAVAQVLVAWEHYLNYADTQLLRAHYDGLGAFMEYYHSVRGNGIYQDVGYGDWCDPVRVPGTPRVGGAGKPQHTTPEVTTTGLFIYGADCMRRIAAVLGDAEGVKQYTAWYNEAAAVFQERFFDKARKSYGSQTADAMALSFGIVPAKLRGAVAESLKQDVLENWNGHASVGALGHRWLYPALGDAGYPDAALGTFYAQGHPGFYYLFDDLNGTTLWERKGAYDPATHEAPDRSLSHPFQGGYDAWFYMGLGGIRPDAQNPGYKHFFLQPVFPEKLDWVKVDLQSRYGLIQSHWKRGRGAITWRIVVPGNTIATVKLAGTQHDNHVLSPGTHVLELTTNN